MLRDKNILIGVASGIAIYKVLDLISRLKKEGANVKVIMTENATKFISPHIFEVMSKSKVSVDQFEEHDDGEVSHIKFASWAHVFLIAPATANTIAKIAGGLADNLLTSTALAYKGDLIFAKTMNTDMLNNPLTQENIAKLESLGHSFIGSNVGLLACDVVGDGRMAEPKEIIDYLEASQSKKDLVGKRLIVTAGPTVEEIDPVRYISNYSSGKMGYALARAARNRGAEVSLIAGPTKLEDIRGVEMVKIRSTKDLYEAIKKRFKESDGLIMAAAPCDFSPKKVFSSKIKKDKMDSIDLVKNMDIIAHFGEVKESRTIVGFAAETDDVLRYGKEKLVKKNLDYILANDVSSAESGFNVDVNKGYLISKDSVRQLDLMDKFQMANIILDVFVDE